MGVNADTPEVTRFIVEDMLHCRLHSDNHHDILAEVGEDRVVVEEYEEVVACILDDNETEEHSYCYRLHPLVPPCWTTSFMAPKIHCEQQFASLTNNKKTPRNSPLEPIGNNT